jgi:hypothetical protein
MTETSNPARYSPDQAFFLPLRNDQRRVGAMRIVVMRAGFLQRAGAPVGLLGAQPLRNIHVDADGTLSATVDRFPRAGDELLLGYTDRPLVRTSIVFPGTGQGGLPVA